MLADPWLTGFAVRARMAWSQRRVRAWLREHNAGVVTVKTRGGVADADALQRAFRGDGEQRFVVFVQRLGGGVEALIAERATTQQGETELPGRDPSVDPDER